MQSIPMDFMLRVLKKRILWSSILGLSLIVGGIFLLIRRHRIDQVRHVANWQDEAVARVGVYSRTQITVLEFGDYQCPSCSAVQADLDRLADSEPDRLTVIFVHYPLDVIHPHARMAAVAAECARSMGRFNAMHHILYQQQSWLGIVPWHDFAQDIGIADTATFDSCLRDPRFRNVVNRDDRLAHQWHIEGTPTFVVNGTVYLGPAIVTDGELARMVRKSSAKAQILP